MKKTIVGGMLVSLLSINLIYAMNNTQDLLYLQAYFNHKNISKVKDYHEEMERYSK